MSSSLNSSVSNSFTERIPGSPVWKHSDSNENDDGLESHKGALYKRKDFLDVEEEAKLHPSRTYYFRKPVELDALIEQCSQRLVESPLNLKALSIRASAYMKKKAWKEAIADYDTVLKHAPDDAVSWFNRGTAHEKLGNTNEAIHDFTETLKLDPDHVNAAYARAACHNRKGSFSEAIEDYNLALSKDKGVDVKTGGYLDSPYLRLSHSSIGRGRHERSLSFSAGPTHRGPRKASLSFQMGVDAYVRNREAEVLEKLNSIRPLSGSAQNLKLGSTHQPPLLKSALSVPNLHALIHATSSGSNPGEGTPNSAGRGGSIPPSRGPVHSDMSYNTVSSIASSLASSSNVNRSTGALDISTVFPTSVRYSDLDTSTLSTSSSFTSNSVASRVPSRNEDEAATTRPLPPHAPSLLRTSSADAHEIQRQLSGLHLRQLESPLPTHNYRNNHLLQQALRSGQKLTKEQLAELQDSGFMGTTKTPGPGSNSGTPVALPGRDVPPLDPQRLSTSLTNLHFQPQQPQHPNASSFSLTTPTANNRNSLGAISTATTPATAIASTTNLSDPQNQDTDTPMYGPTSHHTTQLYAPSPMPPVLTDDGRDITGSSNHSFTPLTSTAVHASAPVNLSLSPLHDNVSPITEADMAHAKGFNLRRVGDFAGAIEKYTRAIELDPGHFKAYFNRGFAYDKIREFEKAVQDYTRALKIDPNNAYAYYNRGIAYDRAGQWNSAIEDFTKAIQILPNYADFYHNRGFCYRKQGRYDLAVVDYTEAIGLNDKHFKAVYNRAFSYDKMGKYKEAIADYTRAIELEPMNANAYHNRGSTYDKMGLVEESIADFDKALELDAKSASTLNSRGLVRDRIGMRDCAIDDFTTAIELEPNNPVFWHNRGFCYRNLGKFHEAIRDYTKAIELDPKNVAAYNNRGYALRKIGRYKEATEDYSKSLTHDPNNVKTYNNRGYAYAKAGMYHEAIKDYTHVLSLDPKNAHAYHNRGISYDKLKMYSEAISDFTSVLELDSSNANAAFNRGASYDNMGKSQEAMADYTRALELDSKQSKPTGSSTSGTASFSKSLLSTSFMGNLPSNSS